MSAPVITFVGAGSVVFTRELLFDILSMPALAGSSLRLHDIDTDRLATAEAMAHRVATQVGAAPEVSTHLDLREAVRGAHFVVNAVAVGGHAATVTDFEVPARFGLKQTIADTLGVGGVFRALRTFPVLDRIAEAMRVECPDAWLLNYTNPMAMNVTYLGARHPDVKVLGLCHSVYWTVVGLNEVIGVPMEGTSYEAAGVNHQAWLYRWERDGQSLYPLLDERIGADPELRRRVRVDMYRRIGLYPTETSEHSSEYVPWFLDHDEEIARLRIPVGDYLEISAGNIEEYERTKAELAAGEPLEAPDATEYAPQVIHAMTTGEAITIHANVPNAGLIPNLPAGLGVEVPTVIDAAGAHPRAVDPLPPVCAALNRGFLGVVDLVTQAALTERPELVRQAVMVDPHAAATLTLPQIDELVDAMVEAHGDLMPEWLRGRRPGRLLA
ncbi:MAG: alpha-galactosidase [Nocardioidaceae bacterium]